MADTLPTATPTAGKLTTIGLSNLAQTAATALAGVLVTHGVISSSNTEIAVSVVVFILTYFYGFWTDYGSVIAKAGLEILRAKVLEAAARARQSSSPNAAPAALIALAAHVQDTPAAAPSPPPVKAVW